MNYRFKTFKEAMKFVEETDKAKLLSWYPEYIVFVPKQVF